MPYSKKHKEPDRSRDIILPSPPGGGWSFKHPDPDNIHRLLKRWNNGLSMSKEQIMELEQLIAEWIIYYQLFGNTRQAVLLYKKQRTFRRELKECSNQISTPQGVRYVRQMKPSLRGATLW